MGSAPQRSPNPFDARSSMADTPKSRPVNEPGDESPNGSGSLEELRHLILAPEQEALERLNERIENPDSRTEDVSGVVAEAIQRRREQGGSDALSQALAPTIETALRESVRKNPEYAGRRAISGDGAGDPAVHPRDPSLVPGLVQSGAGSKPVLAGTQVALGSNAHRAFLHGSCIAAQPGFPSRAGVLDPQENGPSHGSCGCPGGSHTRPWYGVGHALGDPGFRSRFLSHRARPGCESDECGRSGCVGGEWPLRHPGGRHSRRRSAVFAGSHGGDIREIARRIRGTDG